MKFFYINNSLCEGCDGCSLGCPSAAVYASGGKRYIMHEKCTSCGACIRNCAHKAVSIEGIDAMVQKMENADLYLSRIRRLELELSQTNTKLEQSKENFRTLLSRYPSAAAVCDSKGIVVASNTHFKRISGDTFEDNHNISGVLSHDIASTLAQGNPDGEGAGFIFERAGKNYSVRAVRLEGGELLCLFDDLSQPALRAARITEVLESAILRQMETVRRIGTILGDETSLTLNDINRALELLEASTDEKPQ